MKITKEDLIKENAALKNRTEAFESVDEKIRLELSKALGAGTKKKAEYSNEYVYIVWSWPQIYIALGKLLSKESYANYVDQVSGITEKLEGIGRDIFRLQNDRPSDLDNCARSSRSRHDC